MNLYNIQLLNTGIECGAHIKTISEALLKIEDTMKRNAIDMSSNISGKTQKWTICNINWEFRYH